MTKAWAGGLCKTGHYFSALDTDQEGVTHRGSDVRASILKELKIKMGFGGGGANGNWKLATPPHPQLCLRGMSGIQGNAPLH